MFSLRKPSDDLVRRFLSSQGDLPFSHKEVGASREGVAPPDYAVDRYRVKLGEGPEAYERAVDPCVGGGSSISVGSNFFHRKCLSRSVRRSAYASATTVSGR